MTSGSEHFALLPLLLFNGSPPNESPCQQDSCQRIIELEGSGAHLSGHDGHGRLNRGEFYTKLRKTYIIFICTFDPFDRNLSQYTFRETCAEDATLEMGDETRKIFLYSKRYAQTSTMWALCARP
jgi:hypothetical protein